MAILELDDTKCLICNSCIQQLESCLKFREQVERSLKALEVTIRLKKADEAYESVKIETTSTEVALNHVWNDVGEDLASVIGYSKDIQDDNSYGDILSNVKQEDDVDFDDTEADQAFENVKIETVSTKASDDDILRNVKQEDDSDLDDIVLSDLIIMKEPDECRPRRTRKKKLSTTKKVSVKKQAYLTETEKMLQSGLFPFKMGKTGYSCAICPEKSAILDDIQSHIMQHSVTKIHVALKKMISWTLQRFYKSNGKLRCKICKTEISDYDALKNHINNCLSVKTSTGWHKLPFKLDKDQLDCPICDKTFSSFGSLNTHMNVHYPNYICDSCKKAFASKARLRKHMRTHEKGDFPCRYCDAVFDTVTKRGHHESKEHKSGIRHLCKRCNISLSSFYARQKHFAEVHNEELKRYKCKSCTQSYITAGHLSSHVRQNHLKERNHKCSKCDMAFYSRNLLKTHMIKHDGERIHSCNICHKSYQRKKTLREHMRIHNNDKRFICPVCGRAFTQKCTLKSHLKLHERKI